MLKRIERKELKVIEEGKFNIMDYMDNRYKDYKYGDPYNASQDIWKEYQYIQNSLIHIQKKLKEFGSGLEPAAHNNVIKDLNMLISNIIK